MIYVLCVWSCLVLTPFWLVLFKDGYPNAQVLAVGWNHLLSTRRVMSLPSDFCCFTILKQSQVMESEWKWCLETLYTIVSKLGTPSYPSDRKFWKAEGESKTPRRTAAWHCSAAGSGRSVYWRAFAYCFVPSAKETHESIWICATCSVPPPRLS